MITYHRRWVEPERYLQRWLDPRLAQIRVADVQAYLRLRGWKQVPPDRPHTLVYQEPADRPGESLYQFVPDSESGPDFQRRMIELITLIAFYEDRFAGDIVEDILRTRETEQSNGAVCGLGPGVAAHGT